MSNRFRVGVTPDFATRANGLLEPALAQVLPHVDWEFMPDTGSVARSDVIDRYDGVIVFEMHFTRESLRDLRRLAVVARWGVGYETIDLRACTEQDVILAITPEAVHRPVAEGIFTFIFALAKDVRTLDRLCRAGLWRTGMRRTSHDLDGRTLGSLGAGNIAREMFRIAHAIGFSRLLAYDPLVTGAPDGVQLVDFETLFRESDFVTVNCPLNDQTRNLVGATELRWMKPTAYLINTARGPIVNQGALVEALRDRWIAGAGLDVFEVEPIAADNPLARMENVIMTPHAIAWTQELFRDNSLYACRNVLAVSQGDAPTHVVNREVLDRPGCRTKLAAWKVW